MEERPTGRVRFATEADATFLPEVERSAAKVFRDVPELSWIAEDDVQSPAQHRAFARMGTAWVAVDEADRPFAFLSAERCDDELHVWEVAVRRSHQGLGAGRALLEAAFTYARNRGLGGVTLTTFRDLPWNEPLYRHIGFTTLTSEQLSRRLSKVLANERANGLPGDRRCAMRFVL